MWFLVKQLKSLKELLCADNNHRSLCVFFIISLRHKKGAFSSCAVDFSAQRIREHLSQNGFKDTHQFLCRSQRQCSYLCAFAGVHKKINSH